VLIPSWTRAQDHDNQRASSVRSGTSAVGRASPEERVASPENYFPRRRRPSPLAAGAGSLTDCGEKMDLIEWVKSALPLQETSSQQQPGNAPGAVKRVDDPLPEDVDHFSETIQVPGIWRQDPNEIKWALIESRKRASEIVTVKCTLK
jgi:hypothetical protein